MGWVTSVLTTTDFIQLPSKGRTPGWLSHLLPYKTFTKGSYIVSDSSSQVRPCDALSEPEKDQKEENPHKIWPSVVSDLIFYVKSGLLCIFQSRKMEEEKWSALSPRLFSKVRKEKEVSQALSFFKSPQRSVLQQQRLRRDITISLYSNNVSLTKIPWFGSLSTFLSLKSFELVKLKTLVTNR